MSNVSRRIQAPPSKTNSESDITKAKDENRKRGELDTLPQLSDSPACYEGVGQKPRIDGSSPTDSPSRAHRINVGTERVIQKSPLHSSNQEKVINRASSGSPSLRKKVPREGGHGSTTSGRSRMGPTDSPPEKEAVVPPFGEWDDKDAAAGEDLTGLFKLVREERLESAVRIPSFQKDQANVHSRSKSGSSWFSWCTCFPWCRK